MKLFALFDETGKCISVMATTDECLHIPSEYEEVTDPEEQRLCRIGNAIGVLQTLLFEIYPYMYLINPP